MASAAELYLSRSRGIPPKPMINIERNIYSFFSKEDADPQACWEERKRQVRDICSIQASRPAYLNMTHCKMREPSNSCPYIYIVPCHNIKPEGGGGSRRNLGLLLVVISLQICTLMLCLFTLLNCLLSHFMSSPTRFLT